MKISSRMMTCCFLVIVLVFSIANAGLMVKAIQSNPEGELTDIKKSIQEAYVSDELLMKNSFINLNGLYERLSGRRVKNETVLLKNGMLGSTSFTEMDPTEAAAGIATFDQWLKGQGIGFMYVQMPYKQDLENKLLPTGIDVPANRAANELVQGLKDKNVTTLDLRQHLSATEEMVDKSFYRTDHHWTPLAAFSGFQHTVQKLQVFFRKSTSHPYKRWTPNSGRFIPKQINFLVITENA